MARWRRWRDPSTGHRRRSPSSASTWRRSACSCSSGSTRVAPSADASPTMVVAPQPVDPFAGIMAFPILPEATYAALDALGGGWMLPAADGLEPDTAILLQTNPAFTSAFLVGMNHEMNAELLWRVLSDRPAGHAVPALLGSRPGRRRHRAGAPVAARSAAGDCRCTAAARRPAAGATNEQIVLLLRGQLLRRYPDMVVYAVQRHARRSPARRSSGRAARCSPGGCRRT